MKFCQLLQKNMAMKAFLTTSPTSGSSGVNFWERYIPRVLTGDQLLVDQDIEQTGTLCLSLHSFEYKSIIVSVVINGVVVMTYDHGANVTFGHCGSTAVFPVRQGDAMSVYVNHDQGNDESLNFRVYTFYL
jgi:hypothetical protein